ncbi:hypothetical protein VIGAN_01371900 [Vigna angularis var. angularis]|uniref:Uncharacterized protein n=1 Tax=Vigna angularis var. angularis TaxID=157739 RepID=A0A0S3R5J6_PHAAN|nr:hypothetical protein VIGAN_01371900 [Vigna angularis var. angularis]
MIFAGTRKRGKDEKKALGIVVRVNCELGECLVLEGLGLLYVVFVCVDSTIHGELRGLICEETDVRLGRFAQREKRGFARLIRYHHPANLRRFAMILKKKTGLP